MIIMKTKTKTKKPRLKTSRWIFNPRANVGLNALKSKISAGKKLKNEATVETTAGLGRFDVFFSLFDFTGMTNDHHCSSSSPSFQERLRRTKTKSDGDCSSQQDLPSLPTRRWMDNMSLVFVVSMDIHYCFCLFSHLTPPIPIAIRCWQILARNPRRKR